MVRDEPPNPLGVDTPGVLEGDRFGGVYTLEPEEVPVPPGTPGKVRAVEHDKEFERAIRKNRDVAALFK